MKLSEIARYQAARELTLIERPRSGQLALHAPFACPQLTLRITLVDETASTLVWRVRLTTVRKETPLAPVTALRQLKAATFHRQDRTLVACFDLPKGASRLVLE